MCSISPRTSKPQVWRPLESRQQSLSLNCVQQRNFGLNVGDTPTQRIIPDGSLLCAVDLPFMPIKALTEKSKLDN